MRILAFSGVREGRMVGGIGMMRRSLMDANGTYVYSGAFDAPVDSMTWTAWLRSLLLRSCQTLASGFQPSQRGRPYLPAAVYSRVKISLTSWADHRAVRSYRQWRECFDSACRMSFVIWYFDLKYLILDSTTLHSLDARYLRNALAASLAVKTCGISSTSS